MFLLSVEEFLRDFRGQLSWGRFCSCVALIVAVVGQIKGIQPDNLRLWLGVAVGSYGFSKLSEAFSERIGRTAGGDSEPLA